jgi:hypothetical protein
MALAHWRQASEELNAEIRPAQGDRWSVLRRRLKAAEARIAVIAEQIAKQQRRAAEAEAERRRREAAIEEAAHWRAIERLRREPNEDNARFARRAFV